jgi:hypothetical protein
MGFALCVVVVTLIVFVNSTIAVAFFIPLLVQYSIFKDVQDTGGHHSHVTRRHSLVGLPLWVAISITIFTACTMGAYFIAQKFVYFGVCIGICVLQSIQGLILVGTGVKIPDTTEIEALGWLLEKELPSEFTAFEKAALNADTDSRKAILSHIVFPLLPTLSSRLGQSPENERLKRVSYRNCMEALTFTPQEASFRTNEAAIMLPKGWEALKSELRDGSPKYSKEETQNPVSLDDSGIYHSSRQLDGGV